MVKTMRLGGFVLSALIMFLLPVGWVSTAFSAEESPPEWTKEVLATLAHGSSQVLLVTGEESSGFHATLYLLEKKGDAWHYAFPPMQALLGEKGFAPPGAKREGDVRTPSGAFVLRRTFGYAPEIFSRMPYRQVSKDDLWVDDVSSPDYNQWVRRGHTTATSFEVMKLDDDRYKFGIIIEYNTDPVVRGAGSAIFIHVRRGDGMPTLGCVALAEDDIQKVLAWLDPVATPRAIMGTRDTLVSLGRDSVAKSCPCGKGGR